MITAVLLAIAVMLVVQFLAGAPRDIQPELRSASQIILLRQIQRDTAKGVTILADLATAVADISAAVQSATSEIIQLVSVVKTSPNQSEIDAATSAIESLAGNLNTAVAQAQAAFAPAPPAPVTPATAPSPAPVVEAPAEPTPPADPVPPAPQA